MKLPFLSPSLRVRFASVRRPVLCGLLAGVSLAFVGWLPGQTAQPQPVITFTPGLPDPSVTAAYTAARTPLVGVALGNVINAVAAAIQQAVQGGVCTQITLLPPAKTSASAQPVATVVLTYNPSRAGELVWVQMLGAGTLTADDGAGHTYDGSQGFFLTLDVNAMATFRYQAPNVSGTYQVLTRIDNVATTLPFFVPDPAP